MAARPQFTAEEVSLLLDESLTELEQECVSEDDEPVDGDTVVVNIKFPLCNRFTILKL